MFVYLKEYRMEDMRDMLRNNRKPHLRTAARLDGKLALITGATSGVGLAAARELAGCGCSLVMPARNREKAEAVAEELRSRYGCRVSCLPVDFSSLTQTRALARRLLEGPDSFDLLIHSAGVHSTRRVITDEGFELSFCVNHLAPFILTSTLLPRLVRQKEARIIYVNSQGHRFNGLNPDDLNFERRMYTGLRGYGAAKTAQLLTIWELADRLKGTRVTVNAMHPGAVKSGIGSNNGFLYRLYSSVCIQPFLKDPIISGESIRYLAAEPSLAETSGIYFNRTYPEKPAPHALDRKIGAVLWDKTLSMTGMEAWTMT
jgi:retinol dehydrogenase 13